MRRRSLMLSAYTRGNRHDATAAIDDAITAAGGWLMDHTLFSNVAASFRFAVPQQGLAVLGSRFDTAGLGLDGDSRRSIETVSTSEDEITVALNVTFIHDEPDLRREIPAVPG